MNKIQQIIQYIEHLEKQVYHQAGENYVTLSAIKTYIKTLCKEEYEKKIKTK